jgi:hypothetical protein
MPDRDGEWLTVQEAAKISGYHPEYIRRLLRKRKFFAKKFSVVWMIKQTALIAYLEKARRTGDGRYKPNQ